MSDEQPEAFEGHAIVELMGHRRLAGYVTPVRMFGADMLRLDVPWSGNGENKGVRVTQYYSGGAIYCLTPTDEETARRVASYSEPLPEPSQLQLPEELDDEVPW